MRQGTADSQAHQGTLRRDPRTARRRAAGGRDPPRHRPGPQDRAAVRPGRQRRGTAGRHQPGIEADEFKPYICQRWNQGLTDASRSTPSSPSALDRQPADRPPVRPPAPAGRAGRHARPAVPKTREITRWLLSRPGSLGDGDQARLAAVRAPALTWTPWPRTSGTSPR